MNMPASNRTTDRMMNGRVSSQASTQADRKFANDSCTAPIVKKPNGGYVTARRLDRLERSLTNRDRAILVTLARVRVASAPQLYRLHFANVTRRQARASLASLVGRRLIARLPRVVGGAQAGSTGYVYALDIAGQRLVRPSSGRPRGPWTVGREFLDHSLAVTELYMQLVLAQRAGRLQLADFATEPACWRRFYGPGGGRLILKPDAFVRLVLGQFEDRWWIEVDRGTESTTALARKCDLYRRYWQTGSEQAASGVYPKTLWLVPDRQRHDVLVDVIGRGPADTWQLFAVAVFSDAVGRMLRGAGG